MYPRKKCGSIAGVTAQGREQRNMDVKCDYCGSFFDDQLATCPNCGATNEHIRLVADEIPKTIEELQAYCTEHKVPVQQMHFHIGENYKGAKAFGIYRDGGNVVVYKNKADGSRAVRYQGSDEAYAVNEIYQKMRSEYANHKEANADKLPQQANRSGNGNRRRKRKKGVADRWERRRRERVKTGLIFAGAFLVLFLIGALVPSDGYYNYNGRHYYMQDLSWYEYDDAGDYWFPSSFPEGHVSDYYESSYYDSDSEFSDFSDSEYYQEPEYSSGSSWDDDDSWDSGSDWDSWDSGSDWDWDSGSDWDSDW